MKHVFPFLMLALLTGIVAQAQDFSGIASYQSKTSFDMEGRFEGRQMSEQQKKQIAERMKSMLEKTFTLKFTKAESLYTEDEKLAAPGAGGGGMRFGGMFSQGGVYKNVSDSVFAQKNDLMGKIFLIKDSLPQLQWKLEKESKMIGQYAAFKATAIRKIEGDLMASMIRRRQAAENKGDATAEESIPEEVITAWYTPQIPINQGPGEFWGLPGLILEVSTSNTVILCHKIVLNPKEGVDIAMPDKGKEVSRNEYNAILEEKTREMAERFRSQGGRGPAGRG